MLGLVPEFRLLLLTPCLLSSNELLHREEAHQDLADVPTRHITLPCLLFLPLQCQPHVLSQLVSLVLVESALRVPCHVTDGQLGSSPTLGPRSWALQSWTGLTRERSPLSDSLGGSPPLPRSETSLFIALWRLGPGCPSRCSCESAGHRADRL